MKTLNEILSSQSLKPYLEKSQALTVLNNAWCLAIPEWANHSRVANFEDGALVLQVENAAIATRFRYALPEIKKKLLGNPNFPLLKTIKCKIAQPTNKKEETISRQLSPQAESTLGELLEFMASLL